MAQITVAQFATELKIPADALLEQLRKAGVVKSKTDDVLSEQDKSRLLEYLRRSHGAGEGRTKITLTRRETTEIKAQDAHGKSHTVQVEVRKKRTFVKRDDSATPELVPAAASEVPDVPVEAPVEVAAAPEVQVEAVVEAPVVAPEPVVVPEPVVEATPAPAPEPEPEPEPPFAEPTLPPELPPPATRSGRGQGQAADRVFRHQPL